MSEGDFPDPGQPTTRVSARTPARVPPPADGGGQGAPITARALEEDPWPDPGQDTTARDRPRSRGRDRSGGRAG